ncbi:MAG: phosphodiester glycosidase family protein [Oscillospiraceae bacterium]|nr:phosphodiester glycosidase family protein [Oscillospiraceae bacterium]
MKLKKGYNDRVFAVKAELAIMIFCDVLMLAFVLITFALFHHVLPRVLNTVPVTIPRKAVEYGENGMWGDKFADKFTDGEIISDNMSYRSKDICVTIDRRTRNGASYYVADIYIRNIDNFKTAFAGGKYGKSITEPILDTVSRVGAIVAVNGDYYGIRDSGVCIKNGILYRSSLFADVCVLYYDGTVKTYNRSEFSINQAIDDGAYQAWSFGPMLLKDGQPVSKFSWSIQSPNPRCAFGYYEPGHYCFVVIDGRQPGYSDGMSFQDMSQMFYEMGCAAAYNMDGGQSAHMTFDGKVVNRPASGGRNINDIIYIAEVNQ